MKYENKDRVDQLCKQIAESKRDIAELNSEPLSVCILSRNGSNLILPIEINKCGMYSELANKFVCEYLAMRQQGLQELIKELETL